MKRNFIVTLAILPFLSYGASSCGSGSSNEEKTESKVPVKIFTEFMPGVTITIDNPEAADKFIQEYSLFMTDKAKYTEAARARRELEQLIPLTFEHAVMADLPLVDKIMLRQHRLLADEAYKDVGGVKKRIAVLYTKIREYHEGK